MVEGRINKVLGAKEGPNCFPGQGPGAGVDARPGCVVYTLLGVRERQWDLRGRHPVVWCARTRGPPAACSICTPVH